VSFSQVTALDSESEIAPLVDQRKALVVILIGPRFTADLLSERPAPLQAIRDGRISNTAIIALNYVCTGIDRFNDDGISARGLHGPKAQLETRASWFNPNLESR